MISRSIFSISKTHDSSFHFNFIEISSFFDDIDGKLELDCEMVKEQSNKA